VRQLRAGAVALLVPAAMSLSRRGALRVAARAERGVAGNGGGNDAPVRFASSRYEMTPAQRDVARRQFVVALRTACYGSAAGLLATGGGVTLLAWRNDVHSWADARAALHARGAALREPLRAAVRPWRDYAQSWFKSKDRAHRSSDRQGSER
jgi:hypothetical protein